MSKDGLVLRPALREDAPHLARLLNLAGHGLPLWYWTGAAAEGEAPFDLGAFRAASDTGDFSWRNATLAEVAGEVAGGLISYRIGTAPVPLEDLPPVFRPLQALENQVCGADYVLALAVYPAFRRHGIAARLLAAAEQRAREQTREQTAVPRPPSVGGPLLSLICADGNAEALVLYAARGFTVKASEPLTTGEGWSCDSRNWLLMTKPLT